MNNHRPQRLHEDSTREAPVLGVNRYSVHDSPAARAKQLQAQQQEIEAFAQDRKIDPAIVMAAATRALQTGRVPNLIMYGLIGDDLMVTKHFIAGTVLNLAGMEALDWDGTPIQEMALPAPGKKGKAVKPPAGGTKQPQGQRVGFGSFAATVNKKLLAQEVPPLTDKDARRDARARGLLGTEADGGPWPKHGPALSELLARRDMDQTRVESYLLGAVDDPQTVDDASTLPGFGSLPGTGRGSNVGRPPSIVNWDQYDAPDAPTLEARAHANTSFAVTKAPTYLTAGPSTDTTNLANKIGHLAQKTGLEPDVARGAKEQLKALLQGHDFNAEKHTHLVALHRHMSGHQDKLSDLLAGHRSNEKVKDAALKFFGSPTPRKADSNKPQRATGTPVGQGGTAAERGDFKPKQQESVFQRALSAYHEATTAVSVGPFMMGIAPPIKRSAPRTISGASDEDKKESR